MGVSIIYGRAGSGKSTYCFSEIAKLIDKEKNILVITPEQFSFNAEKKLMESVGRDAVINAEVVTLSRMAYRVINEIGENKKINLTKCGKAMLVYSILTENKKKLKFLGKSDDNIDLSITAITEFKKHGVQINHLKEEYNNVKDKYLKAKLNDMIIIYESFEDRILNKYIDDTDLLTILCNNIENTKMFNDSVIYIDEFAGFTNQEYEVLIKLIKVAKSVTITCCIDNIDLNTNPDTDVFYSNKLTLSKILNIIQANGLKIDSLINLGQIHRFKTAELRHLEQNIYNVELIKYNSNIKNIKLFLAKNQYSEIENVAMKISDLVRYHNLRYKDIAVITNNIELYSSLIRVIFSKYDIPVFIDEKRDLNQNIIVQYILSILDVLSKNFTQESVFNYLKTGFCDIDKDEVFKLENYCVKWGVKQNKWKNDFLYEVEDENKKEDIIRLNELRKKIINPLVELKQNINKDKSAKKITTLIYEFIQSQNIEGKIKKEIIYLEQIGKIDLKNEYIESYKIIIDILDEIVLVFNDDKITLDKYIQILKVGLKNSGLGKIPGTQDQVIFGDIERSRTHKIDTLFIIGLNDGIFPSINKDEGFFDDNDRQYLRKDGIELAKGTIERLYEDNFNIYKAFSTAENRLYLSYASSDSEGKTLRPSILINKIKRIYPNIIEDSDIINKKYSINNKVVTYEQLLENITMKRDGKIIEDVWNVVYSYYKSNNEWYERLQNDLQGLQYTNLPKDISQENIQKLYGNTLSTSVSKLEKYRSCAFSYYLQYGLNLKEKQELKMQSFNTGIFMHEILDEFFEYVYNENIELPTFLLDDTKIEDVISHIIEDKLKVRRNYIFTATARYRVLVKRLKKIISKALKYIIEGLVYSDFNISGTEVDFSKLGRYEPIIIELGNGKKIEITGKIDRIDTAISENGKYLRIIDYKSSAKNIDLNEVYAGLQIQLLTYLDAVCKKEDLIPAGVLYFSLLEQMIKADKKITEEEIEDEIRKNFKMKGLILADVKVIKMHDKNLNSGSSKLIPAAITSSGTVNEKWTNGVNKEEFKILQDYIYKTIKDISKEILKGKIDLKPYNKNGKTPCRYCNYNSICCFDVKNCNNTYNYIDKKQKDDIILSMKKYIDK